MKKECEEHIYDTSGFCEWERDGVVIKQIFSKCKDCGNGKASDPEEQK
jgi:hypothetical protein